MASDRNVTPDRWTKIERRTGSCHIVSGIVKDIHCDELRAFQCRRASTWTDGPITGGE